MILRACNLRTKYTDKPDDYYCSLDEYLTMARKSIAKHTRKNSLIKNEDFVSYVAHQIMMGDWRWDGRGDRAGYRKQCAIWGIKVALRRMREENLQNHNTLSLNYGVDEFYNIVEDKRRPSRSNFSMSELLDSVCLSDLQDKYIRMKYIDGIKITDIAKQEEKTVQSVHKTIKTGLANIKMQVRNNKDNFYAELDKK